MASTLLGGKPYYPEVNPSMKTRISATSVAILSPGLKHLLRPRIVSSIGVLFLAACAANASVIGELKITSGSGVLTVTSNTITWGTDTTSIPAGYNAEVASPTPTSLTFVGGPLTLGEGVDMVNLTLPPVLPINNFMTFALHPNLDYTLTGEGPGSTNYNCAGLANFAVCSPFAGDPVTLQLYNGTTVATLSLNGTVTDGSGPISVWSGTVTANIVANLPDGTAPTPGDIQNYFNTHPNGALTLGNAGDFTATVAPEPGSLAMIGGGLIGLAAMLRRRRAAK